MIAGPMTIGDKSFIQSLSGPLLEEMGLYFSWVCTPTLISEIIGDLKHPKPRNGKMPEEIVGVLASKMSFAHGAEPAPLKTLVLGSLRGRKVPMHGATVPVDADSPAVLRDGNMMIVDGTVQQKMWNRWSRYDFSVDDETAAVAWRAGIEATDLGAEAEKWKPFAAALGDPKSLKAVVAAVDGLMADRRPQVQRDIINTALSLVRASMGEKNELLNRFVDLKKGTTVLEYAPYAAAAARLYLVFAVGLARGFIGPRPSNTIDLQYLFYAPFCQVFISLDKLHRTLWEAGAVTSEATFIWGDDIRPDLQERSDRRAAMTFDQWAAHRAIHGMWPEPIEDSVIYAMWEEHRASYPRGGDSPSGAKTIDDLEPHVQELLKRAERMRGAS